ncbi:MAG: hypothetical protein ACOCYP_09220 [Planctomycetota bacterium]
MSRTNRTRGQTRGESRREQRGGDARRGRQAPEETRSSSQRQPARSGASSRSGSGTRPAARGGSRAKAGGGARGRGASASGGAGSRRGDAARAPRDGARPTRGARREGAENDRRRRREPKTWKDRLPLILISVVVVVALITLMAWPSLQRKWKLDEIEAAEDPKVATELWQEYYDLVDGSRPAMREAFATRIGPVEARIEFGRRINMLAEVMGVFYNPAHADQPEIRIEALLAAGHILLDEPSLGSTEGIIDARLFDGIEQPEAERKDQHLAAAAIQLLAIYDKEIAGKRPAKILLQIIRDPGSDPVIRQAAVENLHRVIDGQSVKNVVITMASPQGADLIADTGNPEKQVPAIIDEIAIHAHPGCLEQVFALLGQDNNEPAQAAAMKILRGPGMTSKQGQMTEADRQQVGQQVQKYVNEETLNEKPDLFTEALQAVQTLRLTGAADQLFRTMAKVDPASEAAEAIANTLGRAFIDTSTDAATAASEDILRRLAEAVGDPERREVATAAIGLVSAPNLARLRTCLEALVAQGPDPQCFEVAVHIVRDLYQREDFIAKHGAQPANVENWQRALAADKENYDTFIAAQEWLVEWQPKIQRATDDPADVRRCRQRVRQEIERFEAWVQPSSDVAVPLGLNIQQVKTLKQQFSTYKYTLDKATVF